MKRIISLSFAALILVSVFVGCGFTPFKPTANTAQPEAAYPEEAKPVRLRNWIDIKGVTPERQEQKNRFMLKYPNISFDDVVHDYITAVAAGTGPDYSYMSDTMAPKIMRFGLALPIDDYLANWDEASSLNKKILETYTYNGKVYGMPISAGLMVFAYNKKLFDEAGIKEAPKTWEELLADAKLLTNPAKQQVGYGMLVAEWTEWFFQYYVWQAGGDLTKMNVDGTATLTFTDPAVIKAVNFYKDLVKAGVTQKDLTTKFDALIKGFAAGKIAMMNFATDWTANVVSYGMKLEDIGICPCPAGPSGVVGVSSVGGGMNLINPTISKEQQDATFKWLSFMASKDEQITMLKDAKTKNAINQVLMVRDDIIISDYVKYDAELAKVFKISTDNGRHEFYGKPAFGKYVDKAVQTIIANPNSDPLKEFQAAQDEATKESLQAFNKSMTSK
jgi:multiple sugar transport system substrate-binding protein